MSRQQLWPLIAYNARQGKRPGPPVSLPPPAAAASYWGSYTADGSFAIANLPSSVQTYATDAQTIWDDVWNTSTTAGYSYTLQTLSQNTEVYEHRSGMSHALGVADLMWMTGDPHYLTHIETYVDNMVTALSGVDSITDIFGGRMMDPDKQVTGTGWIGIRLNEPFFYVSLAIYTRLLHENGVNSTLVSTATTRLQEHWRRWQTGVWQSACGWDPLDTPQGSPSLTHADPQPCYRNFMHPLAALTATAWSLYKITGNTNYKTGVEALLTHMGQGIGYEQGVFPRRATWVHMPNETGSFDYLAQEGQPITYTDTTINVVAHYLDREDATAAVWPYGATELNRGLAYYAMRDAGANGDDPRGDAAGGCGAPCAGDFPIITTPFTAGGAHEQVDGSFEISDNATSRFTLWRAWYTTIPYSDWFRTYSTDARAASSEWYWKHAAIPSGLIEYELRADFNDGYDTFGLAGNEAFDPVNPTLKDGTAITGDMLTYHTSYEYWRDNQGSADADWQIAGSNVFANTDLYNVARKGQPVHDSVIRMFRLTGDLRDLDILCDGYDALQNTLDTGGSGGGNLIEWTQACAVGGLIDDCCGVDDPWSPYRKITQTFDGQGTDTDRLNALKLWQIVAEFTWALHLNQNKTSPGGKDYATRLTYWKARLAELVDAWSETTADCWANNYRGVDGISSSTISNVSSFRTRQSAGQYPFALRDEAHAGLNSILIHRYVSLLGQHAGLTITNPADAMTAANQMSSEIRTNGYIACTNVDHGDSLIFPHNKPYEGTDPDPQRMTYVGYQGSSLLNMWMTGAYRTDFPTTDMTKLGSAISYAHDGETGLTYGNIVRGVATCGLDAGSSSGMTASANSLRGAAVLPLVFDPGGTKMGNIGSALMTLSGGATADRACIPSALFAKEALTALGEV